MGWTTGSPNPGRSNCFFFSSPKHNKGSFLGVYQLRHDTDHSPLSSAEVKNEWSYISTPLYTFMARRGTTLPLN
jgi:hypothetical protein